ncbi:hypothetical protein MBLNU457_g2619t2 [Dothideomycetes sp. NU457]
MPTSSLKNTSSTFYCDEACRHADHKSHHQTCSAAQARSKLLSLAPIIQETFCIYRQLTFPDAAFAVDSETDDTGNEVAEVYVYLDKAENAKKAREGGRLPLLEDGFWDSLGSEKKAIVLGLRFSGGANAVVGLLVKHLLKSLCRDTKRVVFKVRDPPLKASRIFEGEIEDESLVHEVIKFKIRNSGEEYALDLTGAQWGWHDIVVPWSVVTERMEKKSDHQHDLQSVEEYFATRIVDGVRDGEASRTWELNIAQHFNDALQKRFEEEKSRAEEARRNAKRKGSASEELPEEPVEEVKPLLPLMEWIPKAVQEAVDLAETKFATRMKRAAEKATTA